VSVFTKKVQGPLSNHLAAALNSTQLFGHGNNPLLVEVGGVFHTVKLVEVHRNPTTLEDEVILVTSE